MRVRGHLLLTCLLVATFESPIGQSIDGYVIQHTIEWCPDYYDGPRIRIVEEVVNGADGRRIGAPRENFYRPSQVGPVEKIVPVDPEVAPWGIKP
jgi:hypothetical protein